MNTVDKKIWPVLIMAGAFWFVGCAGEKGQAADGLVPAGSGSKVIEGPAVGNRAPDFSLENLKGEVVKFKAEEGEQPITLLVFWATWCPACRHEISEVNEFFDEYSRRGVRVLSINVDHGGDGVAGFAKKAGIRYTVLPDKDSSVAQDYRVRGIPNVLLIDASRIV